MPSWTMTYPGDAPENDLGQAMWEAFRNFAHLDEANAAIHTAPVRYSPITFRLAEQLDAMEVYGDLAPDGAALLAQVMRHLGAYEEDRGRG